MNTDSQTSLIRTTPLKGTQIIPFYNNSLEMFFVNPLIKNLQSSEYVRKDMFV